MPPVAPAASGKPLLAPSKKLCGWLALAGLVALAGCDTAPRLASAPAAVKKPPLRADPALPALPPAGSGRGGYYKDDGPGDNPPPGLMDVPDAVVKLEKPLPRANRPYVVFGKTYTPISGDTPYTQRGIASWYGKKFHGQRTSSGEPYDMYKMTAAHPTLPIPSYVRLTSIDSGKQVIVRINDRGPFHSDRMIDVSYTAALKLGLLSKGSHEVLLERVTPDEMERQAAQLPANFTPASLPAPLATTQQTAVPALSQLSASETAVAASASAVETAAPVQASSAAPIQPAPAPGEAQAAAIPAAETPSVTPPAQPAEALASGIYLQLGAFARSENAESARTRLAPYTNTLGTLAVVQAGTVHRLYGGPFASRDDATHAAQALPRELGVQALVIQR
jgi:rare lipoprotein A